MPQRHATDVTSLVFGTVFAGFTVVWLVGLLGHLDHHDVWWAGPVVLVVAGAAGLVASLRPGHDPDEPSPGEDHSASTW
jgi:fatty acid desaturase